VIELRFHRDLYSAKAVDETAEAFAAVAAIERSEDESAITLAVEPRYTKPAQVRRIIGELQNYALAKTIDEGPRR